MIPNDPKLRHAFDSLTLGSFDSISIEDKQIAFDSIRNECPNGTIYESEQLWVGFKRPADIDLSSLIRCVQSQLIKEKHILCSQKNKHSEKIAIFIIGLSIVVSNEKKSVLKNLNYILDNLPDTTSSLFYIIGIPQDEPDIYRFGDFCFGRLNSERLEHLCEFAGSVYFQNDGPKLIGKLAISREQSGHRIFWFSGSKFEKIDLNENNTKIIYRLMNDYYYYISEELFVRFNNDISSPQAYLSAIGIGEISKDFIIRCYNRSVSVAVLTTEIRSRGWVTTIKNIETFSITNPSCLSNGQSERTNQLRLTDFGDRGLDCVLQKYCRYFQAAANHEQEDRLEEALLHLVYALDLLLGGKSGDSLTHTLSDRVAWVVERVLKKNRDEITTFVRHTYDMRSSYAHRGQRGDLVSNQQNLVDKLGELKTISQAVLAAACWARQQPWCTTHEVWLARIDFLRKNHEGNEPMEDSISQLGLDRIIPRDNGAGFVMKWGD